jgi:hypothetical protein
MFRNMSNWITSVDSAEKGKTIKNEDVAQFFDSIRPHDIRAGVPSSREEET